MVVVHLFCGHGVKEIECYLKEGRKYRMVLTTESMCTDILIEMEYYVELLTICREINFYTARLCLGLVTVHFFFWSILPLQ